MSGQLMQRGPPRPRPSSLPGDGDDLDAGLAELRVGVDVALVGDDDARGDGEHVVAVVPLLALGLALVAAGGEDLDGVEAEGRLIGVNTSGWARDDEVVDRVAGRERPGPEVLEHAGVGDEGVGSHHRHHRVEVHERPPRGKRHGDDRRGRAPAAKSRRASASTACGVVRSPMPMSTAPLPMTRTSPPSIVADPWSSSTPPYQRSKRLVREERVEAVDGLEVGRLPPAGGHGHRVHATRRRRSSRSCRG